MRVVVTGGAGFIGSHLSDVLHARGDEVIVVDNLSTGRIGRLDDHAAFHDENIFDSSRFIPLIEKIRPSLIFHLAAQVSVRASVRFPNQDAEVNLVGTINVLEAARTVGARVLMCSTGGALYGRNTTTPSTETMTIEPESPYGLSKYCAELYLGLSNRMYGTEHAIVRFANVYGPRQNPSSGDSGVIPIFCALALQGKRLTIYGDGKQTRDYIYISDAVAAILAAADHGSSGTWNIGTGTELSVLELAKTINLISGQRSKLEFAPARTGEIERSALSPKLAQRDLGWQPTVSLVDGVKSVLSWIDAGKPDRARP